MRLRAAKHETAADIGISAADIDAAAVEVDITDPQRRGLAPAQARVSQQEDQHPPASRCLRQVVDLFMGEEHIVAAPNPWKVKPTRRIGPDAAAPYGVIKRSRGDEDSLP